MGHRKQPFGYRMDMGQIVLHPQEAETVQFIFQHYIAGTSFSRLVEALNAQPIPYDGSKPWNKNMVARILADTRYTGEDGYPAIIEESDMQKAKQRRAEKQRPSHKTEAQKVLRQLSGRTPSQSMEQQVLDLLNSMAGRPETVCTPPRQADSDPCHARKAQLDKLIGIQPINEDQAHSLIFQLAAARYDMIGSADYETERLKRIFAAAAPMETLDAALLKSTVSAIHILENGAIRLELKNHQMIVR